MHRIKRKLDYHDFKMTFESTKIFCMVYIFFFPTGVSFADRAETFETKVAQLLRSEPENPKCFAEGMRDLTCFWEEAQGSSEEEYAFVYTYQYENSSRCAVAAVPFPGTGRGRLLLCRLSHTQFFVPLDLRVFHLSQPLYNRSLFIEHVFLLDPPANLTVTSKGKHGQLKMSWLPPPLKYMDDSMMYEVRYAPEGSRMGKEEMVIAKTELTLQNLLPGTKYKMWVRVKPDGITYNGYWSAWTDPVFMTTPPNDMDPLILLLIVIISVILFLLSFTVLLSHGRFVLKKLWPDIPTPEKKFGGLFTLYAGDFQEWMVNSNEGMLWRPACVYTEESHFPVEVLSEASLAPPLPSHPVPPRLPHSTAGERIEPVEDDRLERGAGTWGLIERWQEPTHTHWLMEHMSSSQHPSAPLSHSSLLESQDAYVSLNQSSQHAGADATLDDILEESLPLQTLFTSGTTPSFESHSDLGSLQHSSGSGRLSSQLSFEYPNHTWPPKGAGYTYMGVADSGVSVDYSPMSASRIADMGKMAIHSNEYKNEFLSLRQPSSGQRMCSGP